MTIINVDYLVVAGGGAGGVGLTSSITGSAWVWGKNNFGQLGLGSTGLDVVTPTQITG